MYRTRRRNTSLSSGRKVQFADGSLSATVTSYRLPNRDEVYKKDKKGITGNKKLIPLHNSPDPPPMAVPPSNDDINLPLILDRRASSMKSTPSERRFSVTMPKEKKAELLTALKEQRLPSYERKQSVTTPGGSRQSLTLHDRTLSIDATYSSESDDFVDNLTKQKMNLQLRSVTERISEVCIVAVKAAIVEGLEDQPLLNVVRVCGSTSQSKLEHIF